MVNPMKAQLSMLLVLMFLVSAGLPGVSTPTITISSPKEGDVMSKNVFNVTGTAAGSGGSLLQTDDANFQQGTHDNTTTTATGEVVIFPMPPLVKQNNGDPVLSNTSVGHFDYGSVGCPGVVLRGSTFNMWYTGNDGFNNRIGYATSSDGVTWLRQNGGNAVLDHGQLGDWDSSGVSDPWVVDDAGALHMWFTGYDGLRTRIGYASSSDGITWNKDSGAVIDLGDFGKFDEEGAMAPTVVKVAGTFHMWYIGISGTATGLGYATSNDGITWTRQNSGNGVFFPTGTGTFDTDSIWSPSVTFFNNVYKMYYTGYNKNIFQIGVATSVDGTHWVRRNGGNPVLVPTNGKFDWKSVNCPSSLWDGMTEKVWYVGQNATTTQLGFATGTIGTIKGTYTSPPFDFGGDVDFKNINWTFDTPSGTTATMAVRTETKGKPWGAWFTPTSGSDLGAPDGMLFQYMVNLTSGSITKTPFFKDITLQYYSAIVKIEVSTGGVIWYPCVGTTTWTCSVQAKDGKVLVKARATDSTGGHSDILYLNLTVNGDAPVGTILINQGGIITKSRSVTLSLNATDSAGVPSMMVSEDPAFKSAAWEPLAKTKGFTLSDGDGYKTVCARFKDTYGVISQAINATILLDTTPPNGTVSISNGTQYTVQREVMLQLSATDKNDVAGAIISEDQTFAGLQPAIFGPQEFLTLSQGDGTKTVYVRYFDTVGNFRDVSASIILDRTPPTGSLKINNNMAVTLTRMVNLTIDGKDKNSVKEMMVSNLPGLNGSSWEPNQKWKVWELIPGAGNKVVYIRFRDNPGLESEILQDAIQYNPPPNEGIISINGGAKYTTDTNVTVHLELGAPGDITDMQVTDDPLFRNAQWRTYENNISWNLPSGDGVKTLFVKFMTPAGIATESFNASITLDTNAPSVQIVQPTNATTFILAQGFLQIKATDSHGIDKVEVCMDKGPWEQATVNKTDKTNYDYTMKFLGKTAKGPHDVKVRATDPAGNTAETKLTVFYKPKEKKKNGFIPFLDTSLALVAVTVAMVLLAARRKR